MKWILLLLSASFVTSSCSSAPLEGEGSGEELSMPSEHCGSDASKGGEVPPILTTIEPKRTPQAGEVPVHLTGQGFQAGARVLIGGKECGDLAVLDSQTVSCSIPPSEGGPADVLLINPDRKCALMPGGIEFIEKVLIDPKAKVVTVGAALKVTASGGNPPYKFSIYSGGGTVDASSGEFTAPQEPSSVVVRVTDSDGIFDDSVIVVQPALSITLTPQADDPKSYEFLVRGGTPPVRYSVDSSEERTDATGNFMGTAVITVQDGTGATQSLKVKINREVPLTLFPQARTVETGGKTRVVAAGGKGGFNFSVVSGEGKVDPVSGVFTAPAESGTTQIRVTDSQGASVEVDVVTEAKKVVPIAERAFLVAGSAHTCASDGREVKCWGDNRYGQLGNGTLVRSLTPLAALGLPGGIQDLTSGYGHVCALLTGGRVKCWGDNRYGQLGDTTAITSPTPVQVNGLVGGVQSITAGQYHTCAVIRGGAVKCWGSNRRGQLGFNSLQPANTPMPVTGLETGVKQVAAGAAHTCALLEVGSVKCWGYNNTGQIGDGTQRDRLVPVAVQGLEADVSQIALGGFHSCAVVSNGSVKCWGNNGLGQLGDSSFRTSQLPHETKSLAGVRALAAGFYHTCAILESGDVRCWGHNQEGQLGIGSDQQRNPEPASVKDLGTSARSIATGVNHTCARVDGGVRCWGSNAEGQFGNRSRESASSPGRVVSLD